MIPLSLSSYGPTQQLATEEYTCSIQIPSSCFHINPDYVFPDCSNKIFLAKLSNDLHDVNRFDFQDTTLSKHFFSVFCLVPPFKVGVLPGLLAWNFSFLLSLCIYLHLPIMIPIQVRIGLVLLPQPHKCQ